MIQIVRREQFARAAERLAQERMRVRQLQPRLYEVTNTAKNHTYHVRITRRNGRAFVSCSCEAGCPSTGSRLPLICKHTVPAILLHRAVTAMRRAH